MKVLDSCKDAKRKKPKVLTVQDMKPGDVFVRGGFTYLQVNDKWGKLEQSGRPTALCVRQNNTGCSPFSLCDFHPNDTVAVTLLPDATLVLKPNTGDV